MKGSAGALITAERSAFHRALLSRGVLTVSSSSKSATGRIASNGDVGQRMSATLSCLLAERIAGGVGQELICVEKKQDGQTLGNEFEAICETFIRNCFSKMTHLRPGTWVVEKVGGRSEDKVSKYAQYSHLSDLKRLADEHTTLATFLGNGYTVAPDVIIARKPEPDEILNAQFPLVDERSARMSALRESNSQRQEEILHASISCKFTMRSDRAQNTRTEALNLIRNRKGRSPHIVALTAEPTPSRIASLALGTGDVDCVYHFALFELVETLRSNVDWDDALDQLMVMIDGKRIRDISDLPLDLII
ncbi:MAG: restriction endonuclease [Alcanivorax sp.]|nr:restriction endonuclease [Alcanivorax sp.]